MYRIVVNGEVKFVGNFGEAMAFMLSFPQIEGEWELSLNPVSLLSDNGAEDLVMKEVFR
jgi:hypothetical protein